MLHYSDRASPDFRALYTECDVLFATGDLNQLDFPGLEDLQTKKPAFGVYGNHCSGTYFEPLNITNVHNKVINWNGVTIGGFQGCLKYKEGGIFYTEANAVIFADTFPHVDILLLHAGPYGMLDDPTDPVHIGSENIQRYVVEKKPKYVFVGHQYSNAEMEFEGTLLFRTYGARIVEIE